MWECTVLFDIHGTQGEPDVELPNPTQKIIIGWTSALSCLRPQSGWAEDTHMIISFFPCVSLRSTCCGLLICHTCSWPSPPQDGRPQLALKDLMRQQRRSCHSPDVPVVSSCAAAFCPVPLWSALLDARGQPRLPAGLSPTPGPWQRSTSSASP